MPEVVFELLLADFSFEEIWRHYLEVVSDTTVMEESALMTTAIEMANKTYFLEKYSNKRENIIE